MEFVKINLRLLVVIAGIGWWALPGYGQDPRPGIDGLPDEVEQPTQQEDYDAVDTVGIFYFFADNPFLVHPFTDSLLGDFFHQLDPVRKRQLDYAHLGNMGSAHRPIVYQPLFRRGGDVGFHQFDLYLTPAGRLPFYRIGKAFTNLAYFQGSEQADGYFTAQFSRNFAKGINFSLDYKRLSQLGQQDQYPNQNTRNTALAFGLWIPAAKGSYDGFLQIALNTIEQEDNGGIEVEPVLEGDFAVPASAQVFLDEAQTRHDLREIAYTQYYQLGGQVDSTGRLGRAFTFSHHFALATDRYKFFDDRLSTDSSYYRGYGLLTDIRGIRHFLQHQKVENSVRISTFRQRPGKTGDVEDQDQRDLLEAGLVHTAHVFDQEAADSTLNDLFLTGRLRFSPSERLEINAYGHFGILGNTGDYHLNGNLLFDFGVPGLLKLEATNRLYAPNVLQSRFFVSQRPIWNNDFRKTLETSLTATYSVPRWHLEVTGAYHLLNNYIFFDTLAQARQTGTPVSILQLVIRKDFHFWKLHLENTIAIQNSTEDVVRLPRLFAKHSLYLQSIWFKVMEVRLGADLRYHSAYFSNYYHPLVGQFILQDKQEVDFYPALDAFFSMRVSRFRAFFKMENLSRFVLTDRLFYQSAFYPWPDSSFRFGIKWRLIN